MSHFTVIVTNTQEEAVESQLEPFFEQGELGDYFMEKEIIVKADDVESEARKLYDEYGKKHKEAVANRRGAKRQFKESDEWASDKALESRLNHASRYDNYWLKEQARVKDMIDAGSFTEVVHEYYGGDFDDEGNVFHLTNPNAKWDWYAIGGRWSGFFTLNDGSTADVAKVKDIDWAEMKVMAREQAKEQFAVEVIEKTPWSRLRDDDTEESYVKREGRIAPFAVLMAGEWHERGAMGWFGTVSDEMPGTEWEDWFDNRVNHWIETHPEMELTLVDCHV